MNKRSFSNEELFEEAHLGIEVDTWLHTKVGKYIRFRAEQEIAEAYAEFGETPVDDVKKMARIQNKLLVAKGILDWCYDAIRNGQLAEDTIRAEEDLSEE